jgi:methylglyoxal synthase
MFGRENMNIALVSHDLKKELMAAFCIAYENILKVHDLYATGSTGSIIIETTGLDVNLLSNGSLGAQQIIARATYNEIDLVIFFRDSLCEEVDDRDIDSLLKLCDLNNIPFATNIATAEVLIKGLERGDFDWRNYVGSKS